MAVSKTSDLNSLFNNIFDGAQFVKRETELMARLVTVTGNSTMAPRIINRYNQHSAGTIAEGGTASPTSLARTAQGTITPQIVHHMIQLTDEMMMTDPEQTEVNAARESGQAITNKVDSDLIGLASSFTASQGAGGTALTLSDLAGAAAKLAQANALGEKSAVMGAYMWNDMAAELTQTDNSSFAGFYGDLANEAMREWFVNKQHGFMIYVDSNIGTTAVAGTANGLAFHREAILYDIRTAMSMEVEREPKTRSTELHFVHRYGFGINRDDHGVTLIGNNDVPS